MFHDPFLGNLFCDAPGHHHLLQSKLVALWIVAARVGRPSLPLHRGLRDGRSPARLLPLVGNAPGGPQREVKESDVRLILLSRNQTQLALVIKTQLALVIKTLTDTHQFGTTQRCVETHFASMFIRSSSDWVQGGTLEIVFLVVDCF